MKKLSYFLLGIGAFTFVACGGNTESTTTDEPMSSKFFKQWGDDFPSLVISGKMEFKKVKDKMYTLDKKEVFQSSEKENMISCNLDSKQENKHSRLLFVFAI